MSLLRSTRQVPTLALLLALLRRALRSPAVCCLQEADVQALADELKLLRKAAKKRKQAAADSEQLEW